MQDQPNIVVSKNKPVIIYSIVTITPQKILRTEIMGLSPYQTAETKGMARLHAMESPYSLPASVRRQWLDKLEEVDLNRYPDPQMTQLKQAFQNTFEIPPHLHLMFGNGSDELIQLLVLAIARPDACILTVTPGFSMYKIIAEFVGVRVIEVPLAEESFALRPELMCERIREHEPALVFLSCPNNPTGTLWPREDVEEIVRRATGLVVIDEAYTSFASYSMMALTEKYPHVLILRTLSKMGLAGLRLGWLSGAEQWMRELGKLRLPYNVNALSQVSARFALDNISVFEDQIRLVRGQREKLITAMRDMDGIQVFPSEANFILFKVLNTSAEDVSKRLLESKIMIKHFAGDAPLKNYLRVTVGAKNENKAFLAALGNALSRDD